MSGIGEGAQEQINAIIRKLPPEDQAHLQQRLQRVITHRRAKARFRTPGHLGQLVRPGFLQTPMLDLLDEAIMSADRGEHLQWIINCPPQEGKSTRLQDGAAWLLLRRPWLRIAFASYEQGIAAQSGLAIRHMIETHGAGFRGQAQEIDRQDSLGLMLDPDRSLQANWTLADVPGAKNRRPGGVLSVGIGSSFTGRPADVLVVDDPLKGAQEADSPVYRQKIKDWFLAVANTRLSPNAIVIVVQTRWHEDDLSGWLLASDAARLSPEWRHLNIPAQAADDEEDPLGRRPGEWLISARGRTATDWEKKKRDMTTGGGRWWYALYQGEPSPPEGGTFQRSWFDRSRVAIPPEMRAIYTMVDPADNDGTGDEAGILTGGIGADGEYYLLEDASGHYTVARWVRVALFSMLRNGGSRLMYEKSLSGLNRSIRAQWKILRQQARELARAHDEWSRFGLDDWPSQPNRPAVDYTLGALADEDDTEAERSRLREDLVEMWPHVPAILRMPQSGPPVRAITARGTKAHRADLVSPLYEDGTAHHVGNLVELEHQMATWLPTQDSPDRMDAAVHLLTELGKLSGDASVGRPGATGQQMPSRQQAMPQIMRTTRYR